MPEPKKEERPAWVCIECGTVLGHIIGGELQPCVPGENCMTRGPHLLVTCPDCGKSKTFYTSDAIVRAVYQLIDAISAVMADRVLKSIANQTRQ